MSEEEEEECCCTENDCFCHEILSEPKELETGICDYCRDGQHDID